LFHGTKKKLKKSGIASHASETSSVAISPAMVTIPCLLFLTPAAVSPMLLAKHPPRHVANVSDGLTLSPIQMVGCM